MSHKTNTHTHMHTLTYMNRIFASTSEMNESQPTKGINYKCTLNKYWSRNKFHIGTDSLEGSVPTVIAVGLCAHFASRLLYTILIKTKCHK